MLRVITMVRSEQDPAWDAAARMDLPTAIRRLADDLRDLESPRLAYRHGAARYLVDTAQHFCSLLYVVAGPVGTAANTPWER